MKLFSLQSVIFSLLISLFCISNAPAQDQTDSPQARAGALKTWREQCSDPDPDLRLAYIESALATGDVSVQRICIRQALESDNADIRNLGLRAALASTQQLTFSTQIPKKLEAEYKAARDDEEKLRKIDNSNTGKLYNKIKNGFIIAIEKASIEKGYSSWSPLCDNTTADDRFSGKAIITGSTINWIGKIANGGYHKCTIEVSIQTGAKLNGILDCSSTEPFEISADLL